MTVELIVMVPVLFLFVAVMVLFGRVSEARQQVVEAARAGAESAALAPDASAADPAAVSAATPETGSGGHTCVQSTVVTDVAQFRPGGTVTVTVECQVALADLSVPGMPGTTTVTASSTAPIDPYRSLS